MTIAQWQPWRYASEELLALARLAPPRLGEHVCRLYSCLDGSRVVIEFPNQENKPTRFIYLPD